MKRLLYYLIILLCIGGIVFSTYKIIIWNKSIKENNLIKDFLSKEITIDQIEEPKPKYNIDFNNLKEQNSDTVAYIKVNNTKIDYVVVKGNDNSYYLSHNFNKKKNNAGWIFADYHNKFDGTDKNIVIYGHKMKDGSMFGTLKDTLNKDWYQNEENWQLVFVTPSSTNYYRIYSLYTIEPEMYYINTIFNTEEDFINYLMITKSRSIYDFNIDINVNNEVLTLSSCLDSNNQKRVVLHAIKIEGEE